ncbi:MAG: YceI family protein [Flavobacteriales bacterium]|nr:YceI family protein [Flavobacteriales bacterium]
MKNATLILAFCSLVTSVHAQRFVTREAQISFLSETPLEDIRAESKEASAIFDAATGQLAFQLPILSFHFPKALMEEHFNENYMESEQFPKASFRGVVAGLDPEKEGAQPVTATGALEMHGVSQERTIEGTMVRDGDGWIVEAQFEVACEDHNIDIPKVVTENIAEIIGVTLRAELKLK